MRVTLFDRLNVAGEVYLDAGLGFDLIVHPADAKKIYKYLPLWRLPERPPATKIRIKLEPGTPRGLIWLVDSTGSAPFDLSTGFAL